MRSSFKTTWEKNCKEPKFFFKKKDQIQDNYVLQTLIYPSSVADLYLSEWYTAHGHESFQYISTVPLAHKMGRSILHFV